MIRHENRLLADDSRDFCRKLEKILQNLSSAAVVIGALRIKKHMTQYIVLSKMHTVLTR